MVLKIGLPKGRLKSFSEEFFKINPPPNGGTSLLYFKNLKSATEFYYLRPYDIVALVSKGYLDLGVTGIIETHESNKKVKILKKLNFGQCDLVLAAPKGTSLKGLMLLKKVKIATSFPKITKQFFKKLNIPVEVFPAIGSVEVLPKLGVADAIVDISQTGETLKQNGLQKIKLILKSQAVLITNPKNNLKLVDTLKQLEIG